jgi:hypothetical protein
MVLTLDELIDRAMTCGRYNGLTLFVHPKLGPQVNLKNADTGGWICDQNRGMTPAAHMRALLEENVETDEPTPTFSAVSHVGTLFEDDL